MVLIFLPPEHHPHPNPLLEGEGAERQRSYADPIEATSTPAESAHAQWHPLNFTP